MINHLKYIAIISCLIIVGCKPEPKKETSSSPKPENKVAVNNSKKPKPPEIEENEILKPGVLQVEVPKDIPLPEGAIVASGTKLGSGGKKHFYIQIPEMNVAQKSADFFAAELPKHGWEVLNGKGEERIANIISLDFKKENELGRIDSIIKHKRAGTIVHIHLEPIKK